MPSSSVRKLFWGSWVIAAMTPCLAMIHKDSSTLTEQEYDFVIVGGESEQIAVFWWLSHDFAIGGTAGLVVANRLTESTNVSVLVLEGGVS
jgi:hypothetical protein